MPYDVAVPTSTISLVAQLAETKLFLGTHYAEWCTGAPTLEAAVAAASMAQDEIGHARSLYPLLEELMGRPSETDLGMSDRALSTHAFDAPFESWLDFVASNVFTDTALTIVFEAAAHSALEPLGQRARRIVQEERMHWLHAEGWTRRLAGSGRDMKQAFEISLAAVSSRPFRVFERAVHDLVEASILDTDAEGLRDRFMQRVGALLHSSHIFGW